ncbi:MAG: hypothetical protein ACRC8Y_19400 [Chroococcales cyanobacterium]
MNPKYFALQLGRFLAIASAVTLLTPSPSQAQNGNFSDVTGPFMGGEIAPAPNITPLPVVEPPPPVVEPAPSPPIVDQAPPIVDQAPPIVDQAPPIVDQAPPIVDQAPPIIDQAPPIVDQAPPIIDQAPPIIDQAPPIIDQAPPIVDQAPPFVEPALPVAEPPLPRSSETTPSRDLEGQQGVISTTGDLGGEFGTGSGTQTVFAGRGDAQAAVNEAGTIVLSQLNVGNLTTADGASLSLEAQQLVAVVLTTGQVNSVNALINALSSTPGGPSEEVARRLASRLARLLAAGQVNAEQLLDAIASYNEMIMQSNAQFLGNPPPELLAIQISLSRLIEAAGVG